MKVSGRCHCGSITFTADVDPDRVVACHCTDCQTFSGAPFRAVLPVPLDHFQMNGTPKHYVKVAESGNHRAQAFCGVCGTQLYSTESIDPTTVVIRLGCVNERANLPPKRQIFAESAMHWLSKLSECPTHARGFDSPQVPSPL